MTTNQAIQQLITQQLSAWEMARSNYQALQQVLVREVAVNGSIYRVQCNPTRLASSSAKVDDQSLQERQCFLCSAHLPPSQRGLPFKGCYTILVNPFPIFAKHLTIPATVHTSQRIENRLGDMLDLAQCVADCIIFYNGPACGASAPDHAHFQAGSKGFLPIENEWKQRLAEVITTHRAATLWCLDDALRTTLLLVSTSKEDAVVLFDLIYRSMALKPGHEEPMMNILAWTEDDQWIVCIFPRAKHRPACFTALGEHRLLISPASVDLGGVFIAPLPEDFAKITAANITAILSEVCLPVLEFQKLIQRIKEQCV